MAKSNRRTTASAGSSRSPDAKRLLLMLIHAQSLPEKDQRCDMRRMIQLLNRHRRLEWLNWCCKQASGSGLVYEIIDNDGSSPNQVLVDVMTLFGDNLSGFQKASDRLALMLRGRA